MTGTPLHMTMVCKIFQLACMHTVDNAKDVGKDILDDMEGQSVALRQVTLNT